jgi:hypothetical protein
LWRVRVTIFAVETQQFVRYMSLSIYTIIECYTTAVFLWQMYAAGKEEHYMFRFLKDIIFQTFRNLFARYTQKLH